MTTHFARTDDGKPARVPGPAHLGLAVDSVRKDGSRSLVVPVIRNAADLPFSEFRDEYERLIERARTNALSADELQGATLTLTNPGGIGTVASVPRLMPGQGTIVAVGAIGYPAEWRGAPETSIRDLGVGKVMTMSSTYDHRVIQGAESGEFLGRIESLLDGAEGFYEGVFASLGLIMPALEETAARTTASSSPSSAPQPRQPGSSGSHPARRDAGRDIARQGAPHPWPSRCAPRSAGLAADRRSGDGPGDLRPDRGVDGADPSGPAARLRPRSQPRRGAPEPPARVLQHDRLRDRAHLEPRAARVVA